MKKKSLFAAKYYSNLIKQIKHDDIFAYGYHSLKSFSPQILNLLTSNGLTTEAYSKTILSKITSFADEDNLEELNLLLNEIIINPDDKNIWNVSFKNFYINDDYKPEFITILLQFAQKNEFQLISHPYHLLTIIRKCGEETMSLAITLHPNLVAGLSNWQDLNALNPQILNLLLSNGLDQEVYAKTIVSKITSLANESNFDELKLLLKEVLINPDDRNIWNETFKNYFYIYDYYKIEFIAELLKFAQKNEFQLISHTHHLSTIIKKYDEETAAIAITLHPNLIPELANYFNFDLFKKFSTNIQNLLIDNNYTLTIPNLPELKNGHQVFERMMQENSTSVLDDSGLFEEFLGQIIRNNRFDFLETLSQYNITLNTITETLPSVDIDELIMYAVKSTRTGNNNMLNHVLNLLNAHGKPEVLASTASLENDTLFKNLLEQGYTIDPDPSAETNIAGFALAMESQNIFALRYYLDQGIDSNSVLALGEFEGNESIEIMELLITHGLKIHGLHIAATAKAGSLDLIKYFKEKGYDTKHPAIFVAACESNKIELIDFLLNDGANINDPSALLATARSNNLEVVQHLVEKGANPKNLMALNQSLKTHDHELKIAKYLIQKGARLEQRSIISAGLTGNSNTLRWVLKETGTPITHELESVLGFSHDKIIKYTIEHLVPNDAILIGITNESYHFADGIGGVASRLMDDNSNAFIVPLTEHIASDDSLMIKFSGFINPGAGDSYPKNIPEFSLKDINEEKMKDYERLYQRVISFAKKYDIPYLGICLGSQHLSLNSDGFIQPVQGHGASITIHFEKGSIPHFMTLLPHERSQALQECQLDDISAENAVVAHEFAGVTNKLGNNVKLGAISGKNNSVPESVYHGHNQIGVQFHPERAYFQEPNGKINRQKVLLDNFFQTSLNHQKSRSYALETGFDHIDARDSIYQANQKLVNHLESCSKNPEYSRKDHFWGHNLGSSKIPADTSTKDASVNVLTGLTPKDVALARDGDDLILIIKSSGEMLSIESHFAPDGDHRVKSINFADGSRLILNNESNIQDGFSSHMEGQSNFHRNASALNP